MAVKKSSIIVPVVVAGATIGTFVCAARVLSRPESFSSTVNPPSSTFSFSDVRQRHSHPRPGEILSLSIRELGNFHYDSEKGEKGIPADVCGLSGSTVKLCGYMLPLNQTASITRFTLVPSINSCCFGLPPSIEHTVAVEMAPGKTASFTSDMVDVTGMLNVGEYRQDGIVVGLFRISGAAVTPAAP